MRNLAIFASGNGSNFQALIKAVQDGLLGVNVVLLVCDKRDAYVIERAKAVGISSFITSPKDHPSKEAYEHVISEQCQARNVDYIILAGYMRLIGSTLLSTYHNRIINIHPSLLPAFPGLHAIEQAFEKGVKVTGVTIHYVDEGVDTGTIIAQAAVPIKANESLDELEVRIHQTEHALYPRTIAELIEKNEGAINDVK